MRLTVVAAPLPVALCAAALTVWGCTDPVEDERGRDTPRAPTAEERGPRGERDGTSPGRSERERAEREREQQRTQRAAESAATETVAADVAAGQADGGVEQPPPLAAPAAETETPGAAGASGGEPSEYIRPLIHPDVLEGVRIVRFALAEDVIEREPVMISSRFRHNSGPMHVFLEVRNQTTEDVTLLVGFRPASVDRRGGGVSLTIPPSPRYRTRARANTRRAPGEWVCEVMDEHQRVLVTQRFFITPAPPPDEAPAESGTTGR